MQDIALIHFYFHVDASKYKMEDFILIREQMYYVIQKTGQMKLTTEDNG